MCRIRQKPVEKLIRDRLRKQPLPQRAEQRRSQHLLAQFTDCFGSHQPWKPAGVQPRTDRRMQDDAGDGRREMLEILQYQRTANAVPEQDAWRVNARHEFLNMRGIIRQRDTLSVPWRPAKARQGQGCKADRRGF